MTELVAQLIVVGFVIGAVVGTLGNHYRDGGR